MAKIMIVDDEIEIAEMIEDFMRLEDIEVVKVNSGEKALELFDDSIDLVVLDVNMDGITGIDTCKEIRKTSFTPIIFLTCNNSQNDMLLGLGVGADDYMTKPFNPIELVARIKANIRRAASYNKGSISDEIITFDDIAVYRKRFTVMKNNTDVKISTKEFELLVYLIENAHIVLKREQILNHVWGDIFYDENLVNTTVKRLRRKIEDDPENPEYIKTIWGAGYVFQGIVK
jgi:DNA-binding response OmpR family regulator